MTAFLEAEGVTVRVGSKILIDGVSFRADPGRPVALVGPNGAGKSTLLRTLSGEVRPHAGEIRLAGRPLFAFGPSDLAKRRAVLSQSVTLAFPFTVIDIVRMGAGARRGRSVETAVDAALEEVDIGSLRDRLVTTLSGGEQQRVHFARALVQLACGEAEHGPGLLLLDEPTASLDLSHQLDLIAVTRRRAERGTAVVAIVHDLNLASLFAARIVVLQSGRVVADGAPNDVVTDAMLEKVFGVRDAVGRTPQPTQPFVLPHGARRPEPR